MSLDHSTEERLLQELRSYFGYADDQIEFAWSDHEGLYEVALFTYNHATRTASCFTKPRDPAAFALQALLEYPDPQELSYTIQWRVAGKLHTSYFSAGNILMALDKFAEGTPTPCSLSVALNPVS